ncbi:DUF1232 domain-containing protein [Vineibacter terrae]|uniref:DUF1232 domain-containing protein n=1 Tax=Vineibacter terrae TaxID=2586908 RepID=A0A5C8PFP9_9HYPH|nr:DUF1232 domain-containing protein [Vineibacter terrae]TXL72124.1 DUF1232 domain-containing protein [Vineibacter terrae]
MSEGSRIGEWARRLKRDTLMVWLAARDPRVPWYVKGLALCVAGYALSPIDLIPDFIPVLGLLDDLILIPLGIWLVVRLIPAPLALELRQRAAERLARQRPVSVWGAVAIALIWAAAIGVAGWAIWG